MGQFQTHLTSNFFSRVFFHSFIIDYVSGNSDIARGIRCKRDCNRSLKHSSLLLSFSFSHVVTRSELHRLGKSWKGLLHVDKRRPIFHVDRRPRPCLSFKQKLRWTPFHALVYFVRNCNYATRGLPRGTQRNSETTYRSATVSH